MVPDISVVICTFDRPDALANCLRALMLQVSERTFEIIAVDNHPQSGITSALIDEFPSVRWLQEPIPGLSQARNCGISAVRGTVVVTTDDDVLPPQDWLERLTTPLFQGPPQLAATTGNCLPLKLETQAERLFEAYGGLQHGEVAASFDSQWMAEWRIGFPHLWRIGTTANAAFRTSVLLDSRIGPFETLLGAGTPAGAWEDLYCFYRILSAGYRITYVPQASLLHTHRVDMEALSRQLCAYRRGETAFLTLMLTRHHDLRALGQMFFWIPQWRFRVFLGEFGRRLQGKRQFPLPLLWKETLAYFAGPLALRRARK